jgi:hypothetical protein
MGSLLFLGRPRPRLALETADGLEPRLPWASSCMTRNRSIKRWPLVMVACTGLDQRASRAAFSDGVMVSIGPMSLDARPDVR